MTICYSWGHAGQVFGISQHLFAIWAYCQYKADGLEPIYFTSLQFDVVHLTKLFGSSLSINERDYVRRRKAIDNNFIILISQKWRNSWGNISTGWWIDSDFWTRRGVHKEISLFRWLMYEWKDQVTILPFYLLVEEIQVRCSGSNSLSGCQQVLVEGFYGG